MMPFFDRNYLDALVEESDLLKKFTVALSAC